MEEFRVILKARQFVRSAGIKSIPVDVEYLATAAGAKIKTVYDMDDNESGQTTYHKGKHIIIVNGNHSEERQRFTILHEIAHIVLEMPSQHHGAKLTSDLLMRYERRPQEEVFCDVFAAECLLPFDLFSKDVSDVDISLDSVRNLANQYRASLTTTGSRFAVNASQPCAFVLSENGYIRYVSRSKFLNEIKGWINFNIPIPSGSMAHRLTYASSTEVEGYEEISTDVWFNEGIRNHPVVAEESIVLREWNQCLSLLWFDEGVQTRDTRAHDDEEPLLRELDGVLSWSSKGRRR